MWSKSGALASELLVGEGPGPLISAALFCLCVSVSCSNFTSNVTYFRAFTKGVEYGMCIQFWTTVQYM